MKFMSTKNQGLSNEEVPDQGASDQAAPAGNNSEDNRKNGASPIGESQLKEGEKILKNIETDTKRAGLARKLSSVILLVLMIIGIVNYTARYLDKEENRTVNTEHKKKTRFSLPVFLLKSFKKWYPQSVDCSDCPDVDLTIIKEKPTIDNITNNLIAYRWYDEDSKLYHAAIIPPKNLYLNVKTEDFLTLKLYIARTFETEIDTEDEERDFLSMVARASTYKCWVSIFHRNEFLKYLKKEHSVIFGGGLNAHVMISPLNLYETGLEVEMIKNKIKSKRKTKYSMSFNGAAGNYDYVSYSSNNHTIFYDTKIYLNAPIDSRISKFVISKKYRIFDILSSIGGLRSLASLILSYIIAFIIYGTEIKWIEKLLDRCPNPFKFWKLCPYAQGGEQTQTRNEAIKTNVILSTFKPEDEKYYSYIPPKKEIECLNAYERNMDYLENAFSDQIKILKN